MKYLFIALTFIFSTTAFAEYSYTPTSEDKKWLMPDQVPVPKNNALTPERIELGKVLFFDPRLSQDRITSCATCHNPSLGWSDGRKTAIGFKGKILGRSSPTVINTAFNSIQMWDGRKKDLEDQATGPMMSADEMHTDIDFVINWLNTNTIYKEMFNKAYPGEAIDTVTISKAIASFERTVISTNSPFDQWIKGDENALSEQQIRGFRLFEDQSKGNCAICHSAPNFTDNGFHNVGLASNDTDMADPGRYAIRPLPSLKGALKTPTLRDINMTAPYFHDGSAITLHEVMEHYRVGGVSKTNISGNMKALALTPSEADDIVAFLNALTSKQLEITLPILPID